MSSIALIIAYLGCLSSGTMLSMLLLLVAAYVSAAIWLVSHGVLYTGLLYVLVYVGAIVVLIMFVVQLTNTSLSGDNLNNINPLSIIILQNTVLVVCLTIMLTTAYAILDTDLLLSMCNFNLIPPFTDQGLGGINQSNDLIGGLTNYIDPLIHGNNLSTLASSIFNEYGYVLVLSVHAIILAVIGPVKLALADLTKTS